MFPKTLPIMELCWNYLLCGCKAALLTLSLVHEFIVLIHLSNQKRNDFIYLTQQLLKSVCNYTISNCQRKLRAGLPLIVAILSITLLCESTTLFLMDIYCRR